MDKQAFKQRMQNLKSYRENNPGKGYWDWKVETFADGGDVGDPEKERFYQATGRSSSGRPLEEGLKPVFSLEDAANMTPIGDAISAKDAYDAVKNRDWLGAGLAALTVLPFVPSGLRNVKAAARYIPTVNRTEQSLINQALGNISKKRDYLSDIANSRNRVLEDINTIPYRNRAEQADKIFGTNYSETYDLLDDLYQHKYGGIHIKKKNRGKFNALKKRTGKSTEELTHSKNPLTRKRAIFAQNAKKWKHKGRKKK